MTRLLKSTGTRDLVARVFHLALIFAVIGLAANIVEELWGENVGLLFTVAISIAAYCTFPRHLRQASFLRFMAVLTIAAIIGSLIAGAAESAFARPGLHRCHPGKHVAPGTRLHCIELRERGTTR